MEKRRRIEIKERDEWSGIAEFLGNIIAKYIDVVDLDALPEPGIYLTQKRINKMYKKYYTYIMSCPSNTTIYIRITGNL